MQAAPANEWDGSESRPYLGYDRRCAGVQKRETRRTVSTIRRVS